MSSCQSWPTTTPRKVAHKGSNSAIISPITWRRLTQWRSFICKWRGLFQLDIGGNMPIPPRPPTMFLLVFLIVEQFTIFDIFSGPKC